MAQISADLIVIGAGPGGYEIAARRAALGEHVIIIEKSAAGGTCLNRGCIPTKCLCATAERLIELRDFAEFGITVGDVAPDYAVAVRRMNTVVDSLRADVHAAIAKCTLVEGVAAFNPDGSIAVGDDTYTAARIIIATGSRPSALPIPGAELAISSDDFLKLEALPRRLAIIGAGVIGMELASIAAAFGSEVTVLEYCPEILPNFDAEIAKRLRSMLSRRGVKSVVGAQVTAIDRHEDNTLSVSYNTRKGEATVDADMVLMAVGRRPVVPDGIEAAGICVDRRGAIITDDNMETSRAGVYAVGDCNGRLMLAHAASAQAQRVYGGDVDLSLVPSAVFTIPEAAMAGITAEQAAELTVETKSAKAMYAGNGKARAEGHTDGFIKVIYSATDRRLLGVHALGAHASDLVAEATVAIAASLTVDDLAHRIIHSHPTLSEVLARACANAL